MPIRILHTADNHLGIKHDRLPDGIRERLVEERIAAIRRLVSTANERHAHFLVVAGDLFDKLSVPGALIGQAVDVLKGFEGEAVLVLAGNHDYCEGPESKLWKTFRRAAEGSAIIALTEQCTMDFHLDEGAVRFHACPCPGKYGSEHLTGWVAGADKPEGMLHIGIAHGNVEGLGLDADQRYFNMTEAQLRSTGVHTWLLGHIHVPAPAPGTVGRPVYFMPGIHTPDSVRCTHPGHAWYIELGTDGTCHHEQLTTGAIRFHRRTATLEHANDILALEQQLAAWDAPNTVLDLQLNGRLDHMLLNQLAGLLERLRTRFLHLTTEVDVEEVLTPAEIAERFPDGTLPHALLTALLADPEHPGDAQVALDIIQDLRRA